METLSIESVSSQLRALGVRPGSVVLVHTSFRGVRPVEGGPQGLIEALLRAVGAEGTVVMPSWSGDDDEPFDAETSPVADDLGVVARIFRQMPGVRRSRHTHAFAALGPTADAIVSDPLPMPPHRLESPVGRVYEMDGQVLLLGVGHDANTTLHLAEMIAGVPYAIEKYSTVWDDGRKVRVNYRENDHCCQLFQLADEWLRSRGLQREGKVGHAEARLMRSRDVVAVAVEELRRDPLVFLHERGSGCEECEAARDSVAR